MKVVISANGRDIDSEMCETFHRCPFFIIVDTKTDAIKSLENETRDQPTEIGATVGQIVANEGIDTVVTTYIGPNAFAIMERYGIKIYYAKGNVNDAIKNLKEGKLSEITQATPL